VRHISEAENNKALRFVNKPSNKNFLYDKSIVKRVDRDLREGTGPEFFYAILIQETIICKQFSCVSKSSLVLDLGCPNLLYSTPVEIWGMED